jgi:hypothetical protein
MFHEQYLGRPRRAFLITGEFSIPWVVVVSRVLLRLAGHEYDLAAAFDFDTL